MADDDLWRCGATELAAMIAGKHASAREVVGAHLSRIAAVNPRLNAIVVDLGEQALAAADAADAHLAAGAPLGPLHGVPFTVKENIDVAGTATTQGIAALAGAIAPVDAPTVERLRAAGAIVLGRTNTPDLGLRLHTDSSLRGLTRNPWHPDRTAGGSSGGEASAIAAGMSPLGLGNDLGGSLRNPAHCCGITSLKPTAGRVPAITSIAPVDGPLCTQLMGATGPLARSVADVRLALTLLNGWHPRDPKSLPVPLDLPPAGPGPVRVALMAEPPGGTTHPAIAAAVRQAGELLQARGYEVVASDAPQLEECAAVWASWLMAELTPDVALYDMVMGEGGRQFLHHAQTLIPALDVGGLAHLLMQRHGLARAWSAFFADFPLIVCPVWTQPAFPHGFDVAGLEGAAATLELARCVTPANLLGLPAAVVPVGQADGLPVGVQIMGDRFRDLAVLEAAAVIEAAAGRPTPIDPAWV